MADEGVKAYGIEDLLGVMARLRDPDAGCAWDLKQSFATIAPYTIEEAYEVADAIARKDISALKDELGDLLLQVVYHAQLASEQGSFAFADVVDGITRKMIRRHPHVFSDPALREQFETADLWGQIKAEEKAEQGADGSGSLLDDIPATLPALTRAVKLQKRAGKVGFDWPSLKPVLAKAEEEVTELKSAITESASSADGAKRIGEELGDLLFVMANIARHLGVDPEAALLHANAKFVRRFKRIEAALATQGKRPEDATLDEMDLLWDEAKTAET